MSCANELIEMKLSSCDRQKVVLLELVFSLSYALRRIIFHLLKFIPAQKSSVKILDYESRKFHFTSVTLTLNDWDYFM